MLKYQKPFRVEQGRILDAGGQAVRLWGVNYYPPFNHNYVSIAELGRDHCAAIDRDIAHFRLMGVDFVRMHLFDREISDMQGNVVDNDHLRVLDYLIEKLHENEIFVMITTMAWFSSIETQVENARYYANWGVAVNPAFGFSNYYVKHEMIWEEGAIECQRRYMTQLFERRNRFSNKQWREYDNIVAMEVINEPAYPYTRVIRSLQRNRAEKEKTCYGRRELGILDRYEAYCREKGLPDADSSADEFCASLVGEYIGSMFALVDGHFGGTVLTCHIHYGYTDNEPLRRCLESAPVDCLSIHGYAPVNFNSAPKDERDLLGDVRRWHESFSALDACRKGLIAYEFNVPSTLLGYPLAALALAMASRGIQMAAYFTYTPLDVAEYNPGWLVHYLNLCHTPSRAAAFMAAGEIFRSTDRSAALPGGSDRWQGPGFDIDRAADRVVYTDDDQVIHSAALAENPCAETPRRIRGRFDSPWVHSGGNGCYFLEQTGPGQWLLQIMPVQVTVADPYRGDAFTSMANRYVNVNREPAVSRLCEKGGPFGLLMPGMEHCQVWKWSEGAWIPVDAVDGVFQADPGRYRIRGENR